MLIGDYTCPIYWGLFRWGFPNGSFTKIGESNRFFFGGGRVGLSKSKSFRKIDETCFFPLEYDLESIILLIFIELHIDIPPCYSIGIYFTQVNYWVVEGISEETYGSSHGFCRWEFPFKSTIDLVSVGILHPVGVAANFGNSLSLCGISSLLYPGSNQRSGQLLNISHTYPKT